VKTELSTRTNKATSFGILDPTSDIEDSFVIDLKPIPHVVDMTTASTLGKYLKILLKDLTKVNQTGQPVRILVEQSHHAGAQTSGKQRHWQNEEKKPE
jgi:hypothetical protein